jgi:hypothetical protein
LISLLEEDVILPVHPFRIIVSIKKNITKKYFLSIKKNLLTTGFLCFSNFT